MNKILLLLPIGVIPMNDALLRSHVDRLIDKGEQLQCFIFLAALGSLHQLLHHRFHLRFVWLQARLTDRVLACTFGGGLRNWHRSAGNCRRRIGGGESFLEDRGSYLLLVTGYWL